MPATPEPSGIILIERGMPDLHDGGKAIVASNTTFPSVYARMSRKSLFPIKVSGINEARAWKRSDLDRDSS
jgi:hypothetical protein